MIKKSAGAAWLVVLLAVLLVPPASTAWLVPGTPWGETSVVLGMLALALLVAVIVVPSRIRSLTALLGVERVMVVHRVLGVVALAVVGLHLAVALARHPTLLDPARMTSAAEAAWASTAALLLVGWCAARARRHGARYEWWARAHVGLAAAGLTLGGLHVWWLRHLVADPVMRVVLAGLAAALLAVLAHRWVWRPLFSRQGAYVVYGVRREGPAVLTLVLVPAHLRRGGLRFAPGQFVWLRLRRGAIGAEEHPYTIASSATVTGRLELTVRGTGDFSRRLAALRTGRKVWLDGPHGSFTADTADTAHGLVLIAGGVGITPMMSMLRTLAARGDIRRHYLVLAERGDEPLFADELAALARRLNVHVTRTAGRRIDADLLSETLPGPYARDHLHYFLCGSPSLVDGAASALIALGVAAGQLRTEQFGWGTRPAGARAPAPATAEGTSPGAVSA